MAIMVVAATCSPVPAPAPAPVAAPAPGPVAAPGPLGLGLNPWLNPINSPVVVQDIFGRMVVLPTSLLNNRIYAPGFNIL